MYAILHKIKQRKNMTDTEIAKRFKMPIRTLSSWKIQPKNNFRRILYIFMKEKLELELHAKNREEHY